MKEGLEIYFKDLTKEKQKEVLQFYELINYKNGNFDIFPITTIPAPIKTTKVIAIYNWIRKKSYYCQTCDNEIKNVKIGDNCPYCACEINEILDEETI